MAPFTATDDTAIDALREELAARILRLTPAEGLRPCPSLPDVTLFRSDGLNGTAACAYEPCVALTVQGHKRVVLGAQTFIYGTRRYLVSSMNLPTLATVLEASPERPYLAVVLRLDLREIASLMLGGDLPPPQRPLRQARAMDTGQVTEPLLDAFSRLLALPDQPASVPFLAPLTQREILYRLLLGDAGGLLRQMASIGSQSRQIAGAIDVLQAHYSEPLGIDMLARQARMSVSRFHHLFKQLTGMSPLQFQKQLRLAEARRLMMVENVDAATAAYRVGYESASQFSREYCRQFGSPPKRDIASLRG